MKRPELWRRLLPKHPVRHGVILVLLALVVEYLILPQIAGVNQSLHLLGRVNLGFVAMGVALEIASLACYGKLTQTVLPRGTSRYSRLWRIDLATLAVSHVLPGGTAGGDGLGYKLLMDEGSTPSDAGFALATQGIGSALVLNAILWVALIVSIPLTGFNPIYGTAAALGGVVFAAFAAAVLLLTKGEDRAASFLRSAARRLPLLKEDAVDRLVHSLADRIRTMASDPALLRRAVAWATLNWLLDAASLFVFLAAFGHVENPDGLVVAYGLANVLAAIPVSPGGLGIVEGVLVPSLVGFGSPRGIAVLGVVSYRLVNFWLPIPAGAGAYLSLGRTGQNVRRRRAEVLKNALAEAAAARTGAAGADPGPAPPERRTAAPEGLPGSISLPGEGLPG